MYFFPHSAPGLICTSRSTDSDAVLNHKMGADEKETFLATAVDSNDRTKDISDKHNITAWSKSVKEDRSWMMSLVAC